MKAYYAGWDGGGTKTRVCILDGDGREKACMDFGPLNPNGAGEDTVRRSIRDCVRFMADAAPLPDYGCLVIGMAGISSRPAAQMVEKRVREAGYTGPLRLLGDQEIALEGAIQGHGAVLIAGTGSVCFGRDEEGRPVRTGGYGYLIDDEGSGYAVGRDILKALVRAEDGRGPDTCLREMVYDRLHMQKVGDVISWLYAKDTGKKEIAALAQLLPPALLLEDREALHIADKAAEELSQLVKAAWEKSGMKGGELALTGSMLEHVRPIRDGVIRRVHAFREEIRIISPRADPARGAAALARATQPGQSPGSGEACPESGPGPECQR